MDKQLVSLEPHEVRCLIESIYNNRKKIIADGWGGGTIPLFLSKLGSVYGTKSFIEDYPQIVKYIDDEIGGQSTECESEHTCNEIKRLIDDEEKAQREYTTLIGQGGYPVQETVNAIKKDELRHYNMLKKLYDKSCRCNKK